ncbi:ribosome-binding protein 1 isoform X2 [Cryptotermes secundus]|nr:ribosome-binding protein 1 isoform X2 [Cryptotermes secundus]
MFVFIMEVSHGTNYVKQGTYFRLLGIELKEMFINNPDLGEFRRDIILFCIFYTLMEFIVSALLFFGLDVRRIWCAVPWMLCKSVVIIGQVYGRINYFIHEEKVRPIIIITSFIVFVMLLGQLAAVLYAIREMLKQRRRSQIMEGRDTSQDKFIDVRRYEKASEVVQRDEEESEIVQRARESSKVVEGAEDKSRICQETKEEFQVVQGAEEASEIPQGMEEASKVAQVSGEPSEDGRGAEGSTDVARGAEESNEVARGAEGSPEVARGAEGSPEVARVAEGSTEVARGTEGSPEVARGTEESSKVAQGAEEPAEVA